MSFLLTFTVRTVRKARRRTPLSQGKHGAGLAEDMSRCDDSKVPSTAPMWPKWCSAHCRSLHDPLHWKRIDRGRFLQPRAETYLHDTDRIHHPSHIAWVPQSWSIGEWPRRPAFPSPSGDTEHSDSCHQDETLLLCASHHSNPYYKLPLRAQKEG